MALGAVLEETEDIKNLIDELREKVQARVQGRLSAQRNVRTSVIDLCCPCHCGNVHNSCRVLVHLPVYVCR